MSEISKLNINTVKLPSHIMQIFNISSGYAIGFYSNYEEDHKHEGYIYLYKIKDDDFINLQKFEYIGGWHPIIGLVLQNNTLLTAGRNSVMFYKIKDDKLYRTSFLCRDHNKDSLAEILEAIQIENGKIILQNILGDIYVLNKNKNYIEKEVHKVTHGYIADDENDEYQFVYKFPNTQRWKINPIGYTKGNIVFFNNFKVNFSNDKYEKITINEINITKNKVCLNYRFDFDDFILLKLESEQNESIYGIIDKRYYEIVSKIIFESDINEIIHINENKYLCNFTKDKSKIYLIDLTNYDAKIIDSKSYDYNINRAYNKDKIFISRYGDKIFVLENTI